MQLVRSVQETLTVAKHLVVRQLAVLGVEDAEFEVDRALGR